MKSPYRLDRNPKAIARLSVYNIREVRAPAVSSEW